MVEHLVGAEREKYLYRDRQSDLLSIIGAYATYGAARLMRHGRLIASGLELLKRNEPGLIAPTHQSSADIPVVGWAARLAGLRPPSFIAKFDLVRERRLAGRHLLPLTGAFYINQDEQDRAHIERHIQSQFDSGRSVVFFPEGTRRPAGQPVTLERGLGVVAARLGASVTPVGIYGSEHSTFSHRQPVGLVVAEPLSTEGNPLRFRKQLTEVLVDLRRQAQELVED